ncbi:unnamed protein product [Ilex paraguariensis]|uniref:C2H2-type domain-containing protein n=1 Tax=Ilex paraguariensis TaxID=185542 RepID=A0ABC8U4L2_9AQUA
MDKNTVKNHSMGTGRPMKDINNHHKVKDLWDCSSGSHGEEAFLSGFSWPPRFYTCSFCKREFKSAQALGGHMNVHRRDRARLRQSPPRDGQFSVLNLDLDPNPSLYSNPKPNFSSSLQSSSPSTMFPPFTSSLPPLVSPSLSYLSSPSSASPTEIRHHLSPTGEDYRKIKSTKTLFGVGEINGLRDEKECKIAKKAEIVRLDLEIGLLNDSEEDLDLELRLGYS